MEKIVDLSLFMHFAKYSPEIDCDFPLNLIVHSISSFLPSPPPSTRTFLPPPLDLSPSYLPLCTTYKKYMVNK